MHDPACLLGVECWKLLQRHKVNEEVVSDLRVSINALLVSLSHSLSKNSRILSAEQEVDSCQLNIFVGAIVPVTSIDGSFSVICVDKDVFPGSSAVLRLPQTLAWDWVEGSIRLLAVANPLRWLPTVVLGVVKGLKGEPLGWRLAWS